MQVNCNRTDNLTDSRIERRRHHSMTSLQRLLDDTLARLLRADTDLQDVEVKDGSGGTPGGLPDVISAFATGTGGLLIIGLSETESFKPTRIDAPALADAVANICAHDVEPPIRPDIDICSVDGQSVLVVSIDELSVNRKPCYVKTKGLERGVFVRTHDGQRTMTTYEIHLLLASRGQPYDDRAPVPETSIADLDRKLVDGLIERLRTTRGPIFQHADEQEILELMGVTVEHNESRCLSLAGLLALGRYPQRYFPQLDITLVVYPTTTGEPMEDGTRFLDNQSIDGSIPAMVSIVQNAMRRNMKRRSLVTGSGREDRWEYPEAAIRELVVNALMHRDYHPMAHGTQVRISVYPDRLEITNPGGLHGPISRDSLLVEPVSSISRNATLTKLLEDTPGLDDQRMIAENRGSGLLATATLLRRAGMDPPELVDAVHEFTATLTNNVLLDKDSSEWLASKNTDGLNGRQRLALVYLRRRHRLSNRIYRTLNGCDAQTATRELGNLHALGWLAKLGDRRGTTWTLADSTDALAIEREPDLFDNIPSQSRQRADRRDQILAILQGGALSATSIAERIGISKRSTQAWLARMEAEKTVRRTEQSRTSRLNLWQLRNEQDD